MQHAYEKEPDSIYEAIARLRWPQYRISGIGGLAVVLECSGRLVLCSFPMAAEQLTAEKCGATCNHPDKFHKWHRMEELSAPQPEIQTVFRNRGLLERD